MKILEYFYSYFSYALTFFLATYIFVIHSLTKPKIMLRFAVFAIIETLLCLILAFTKEWQDAFMNTDYISYLLICIALEVFVFTSYIEPISKRFCNIIAGMMMRHAASRLGRLVFMVVSINNFYLHQTVSSLVILLTYVPVYFLLGRRISKDREFSPRMSQLVFIFIMNTIILMSAYLEPLLQGTSTTGYVLLIVIEASYCYFVLGFQFIQYLSEKRTARAVYEQESTKRRMAQYDYFQSLIDVMNEKCHNLKHQIRNLSEGRGIDEEILRRLTATVSEYEAFVKTGNEELDVILTEKSYVCLTQHVAMKCMVDGKALSFLSTEDLHSLFGNAIDNALEYLEGVEEEKRFLHILSSRNEYFFKLSFENYFEGEIRFRENGLPLTSKKDKYYHGFGTRSIARIAKTYGGVSSFRVEDGTFKTEIVFPLKKTDE